MSVFFFFFLSFSVFGVWCLRMRGISSLYAIVSIEKDYILLLGGVFYIQGSIEVDLLQRPRKRETCDYEDTHLLTLDSWTT